MISRALAIAMALATVLSICGCANTMRGVGTDMERNTKTAVRAVQ
jgi:predicted small secreted protein